MPITTIYSLNKEHVDYIFLSYRSSCGSAQMNKTETISNEPHTKRARELNTFKYLGNISSKEYFGI
jgi:hypothetical protein